MRIVAASIVVFFCLIPFPGMAGDYVRTSEHFAIGGSPEYARPVDKLTMLAEEVREELCQLIDPCFVDRVSVRIAGSSEQFQEEQPGRVHIDWASGIAYPSRNLILLRIDNAYGLGLVQTFRHEVSHIALDHASGGRAPRWFSEGLAIMQAGEDILARFEQVSGAVLWKNLMPFEKLARSFPSSAHLRHLAYSQSALFMVYLKQEIGSAGISGIIRKQGEGLPIENAFYEVTGRNMSDFEREWKSSLESGSNFWVKLRDNWWLWTLMSLLFIFAGIKRMLSIRRRRRALAEEDWDDDEEVCCEFDQQIN